MRAWDMSVWKEELLPLKGTREGGGGHIRWKREDKNPSVVFWNISRDLMLIGLEINFVIVHQLQSFLFMGFYRSLQVTPWIPLSRCTCLIRLPG